MELQQVEDKSEPLVWLLVDDRPGNTTQSVGLAQALGWPYETKQLHFTALAKLRNHWLRTYGANLLGLDRARSAVLSPPWPNLVITAGLRTAPIARWIKKQNNKTLVIQIGRKGGHIADHFDAVITCGYAQFPPHPQRIETSIPITRVTPQSLIEANHEWEELFQDSPHPRIALLVGGSTTRHQFHASAAGQLGIELAALCEEAEGSIFAITSRRTGAEAEEALRAGLGNCCRHFHGWASSDGGNPYLGYLGSADIIVVTGESESMLAEAAMTGRPVYIYRVPELPLSKTARFGNWLAKRARRIHDMSGRSTGICGLFDRFCSLLIAKGLVRPPRDLRELHETLIRAGIAHRFGDPLTLQSPPPLREMEAVSDRVKSLLQQR